MALRLTAPGLVVAILYIFYNIISRILHEKSKALFTAVGDIPLLGVTKEGRKKMRGTAVICGGSISGLLSARVCSDHFETVIIVEPEAWLASPEGLEDRHREYNTRNSASDFSNQGNKRSHVAQYTAHHEYQSFMVLALQKLFPTLETEIQKSGGSLVPADPSIHVGGVPVGAPYHLFQDGRFPKTLRASRPALETTLRRLVLTSSPNPPNCVSGTVVSINAQATSANIIESVRVRSATGDYTIIPAALVVDCTGAAHGGFKWLREVSPDLDKQLEDIKLTYDPKMTYTTCEFNVPPRLWPALKAMGVPEERGALYANFPANPRLDIRSFMISRKECNLISYVCGGWDFRDLIRSTDDMKEFFSNLNMRQPLPRWVEAMVDLFEKEEVPVTFDRHRAPPSVYIQYHRVEGIPRNFVAVGDSVLKTNPVRGQGCTKSCVDIVTLNSLLSKNSTFNSGTDRLSADFSRNFFVSQAWRTGLLWYRYKFGDYAWKTTTPEKGDNVMTTGSWVRKYESLFIHSMTQDRDIAAIWWHYVQFLAPPTNTISPTVIWKILYIGLRGFLGITFDNGTKIGGSELPACYIELQLGVESSEQFSR